MIFFFVEGFSKQLELFIWLWYVLNLTLATYSYLERYVLRWGVWIRGMRFCDLRKIIEVLLKRILYLFWCVLSGLGLELYELSLRKWGGMRSVIRGRARCFSALKHSSLSMTLIISNSWIACFLDPVPLIDIVVIFILVAMLYKFLSGYDIKTAIDIEFSLQSLGFCFSFEILDHCYLRHFIIV